MLPLALLSGTGLRIAAGLALAAAIAGGYWAIRDSGVRACERDVAAATAMAQEEAHQYLLAEVARGEDLSKKLTQTQRKLNDKQAELLAYANGITGNCSGDFGVFVASASGSGDLSKTASPSPAAPPTKAPADIAASIIAFNVATNYTRLDQCVASFNALLDWHEGNLK